MQQILSEAEEKDDGITVEEEIDGWRESDGRSIRLYPITMES